jgi:hypothetical protein
MLAVGTHHHFFQVKVFVSADGHQGWLPLISATSSSYIGHHSIISVAKARRRVATTMGRPKGMKDSKPRQKRRKKAPEQTEKDIAAEASCPVLVQHIEYNNSQTNNASPEISLTPDLADLMYPMSAEDFLRNCFRNKAVHVTCKEHGQEKEHAEHRISKLCKEMCDLDASTILRETSSDNIFLWLRKSNDSTGNQNKNKPDGLIQSIEISDCETAIALHIAAGHATYCRAPPKVEQSLVASLLRATGLGCGQYDPSGESLIAMGRGEVETFISTDGHVTNWHFDFQENFTIQLSGTKRWTLQQGTIQDPARGCTPHYAAPGAVESQLKAAHLFDRKFRFGVPEKGVTARGDVRSVDVKPGDVLYFPAGMWHKVETIEPGVSINVSLMASNYAAVTCQALHQFLLKDKGWREPIINNSTKSAVDHLKTLLKDLPSLIQELESNGRGAEYILPPILQRPPKFHMADEEEDWEQIDEGSDNEEDSDGQMDAQGDQEGEGSEKAVGADSDTDIVDDAVDPLDFDSYADDWSFDVDVGANIALSRNPLAALHRSDEITTFYKGISQSHEGNIFVLNVNYAGNEMQQSTVRVVLKDNEQGFVQWLYEKERESDDSSIDMTVGDLDHLYIKFLVYHGYLQRVCDTLKISGTGVLAEVTTPVERPYDKV